MKGTIDLYSDWVLRYSSGFQGGKLGEIEGKGKSRSCGLEVLNILTCSFALMFELFNPFTKQLLYLKKKKKTTKKKGGAREGKVKKGSTMKRNKSRRRRRERKRQAGAK